MYNCEFCEKNLSSKQALNRHQISCKLYKNEAHKKEIQSIHEHYQKEIQTMKTQLEEYKAQIFEIAKQPKVTKNTKKTTTNNNQRTTNIVNQLGLYNLSKESIDSALLRHFTEETFYKGPPAIAKVVIEHVLTDPVSGRRVVVCTDAARKKIRYTVDGTELKDDVGMTKTVNMLTPSLRQANVRIYNEIHTEDRVRLSTDDVYLRNSEFLKDKSQLATHLVGHLGTNVYLSDETE